MKLKDCLIGVMVVDDNLRVGHVVGLTYNVDLSLTGGMTNEDKLGRTIPLVQFPDKIQGIHHENIKIFRG